uniref:Flavoprotein domain-containing protein n=1 Tax=Guillardia theta TaxID=55529 RepID=A0A7S4UE47_GUITH|mmetsp:Transcript_43968/g.138786  ORF Transcript_43968/g.138786 Transcript_43968/m.138786 type:complete len:288 (+) Transcript_43968:53-916(+)
MLKFEATSIAIFSLGLLVGSLCKKSQRGALLVGLISASVLNKLLRDTLFAKRKKAPRTKKGFDESIPKPRIVIAASGSVATVKVPQLALALAKEVGGEEQVKVVVTSSARRMLALCARYDSNMWRKFCESRIEVLEDDDEWNGYDNLRTDKVVHIELRRWADCLLLAPCSANTIGKVALGLSDNLVTCIARAWDPAKTILVAPAMNTIMWEHPATCSHLKRLEEWGYRVIPPATKILACNEKGAGALAEVDEIVAQTKMAMNNDRLLRLNESGTGNWTSLGYDVWKG